MNRKNAIKAALDLTLTLGFLFLMEPKATGMPLHEWGGLGICVFFVVHKLLNIGWIKAVSANFFKKSVKAATRLGYLVDLLLLIGFGLIALSGMAISKSIDFTWLLPQSPSWKGAHAAASFLILLAVGIHVGLHASWIGGRIRDLARGRAVPKKGESYAN